MWSFFFFSLMIINFLHSHTHDHSIRISHASFLILGIVMGLLISFVLNIFIEDKKTNESISAINAPPISYDPIADQNPIDPATEQNPADICQTNTTINAVASNNLKTQLYENQKSLLKIVEMPRKIINKNIV